VDYAIEVRNIGKKYRIGSAATAKNARTGNHWWWLKSPIGYLTTMLRPPDENEILWALRDISFDVKSGETLGIIGSNGAGKSTLLKILSRITEPTEGRARIKGRVGSLLEVGTGFHPQLTGRENIFLKGSIMGMKKEEIQHKFDEIVAFTGVERFLDTPVKRYSSGMYVRLAFSVAANLLPEILIIDEVLAVGDASFRKKSIQKMTEIVKSGRTIILVSHNMEDILALADRVIWIDSGQLILSGSPREVVDQYTQTTLAAETMIRSKN
jgi:lipopolysaccharide transport system ATP-binding protein